MRIAFVICLAMAVSACALVGDVEKTTIAADEVPGLHVPAELSLSASPVSVPASISLPNVSQVSRPIGEDWLLAPLDLVIHGLDARQALQLIVGHHSIRFDLNLQEAKEISYESDDHTTIQDGLQAICLKADWLCRFENDSWIVRDLETRTLPILAQPGAVTGQLSVNSLDSNEKQQFNDGEAVTFENVDPYVDELEPLIKGLLERDVAEGVPVQHQLLPRANSLLVSARPSTVSDIADIVSLYNERTAKLVRVYLTVIEVASTNHRSIGSRLSSIGSGAQLDGGLGWNLLPLNKEGQFNFRITNPKSPWRGSELLLEWLDNEGNASVSLKDQLDIRNNRIASSSATRTFQYVASITRELDNLGRERTEVKREQLRTGWAISVHPTIGLDTVTVRLSLARRALVEERPFTFGDTSGTNFVTDDQNRSMSVTLKDGEARVITLLTNSDERKRRNKLAGLVTRRAHEKRTSESVILMRVELI